MQAAVELYPEIPVALHLDHGNEPETCRSAIELGFTSVMMDGSLHADGKTVADYEYNVAVTREVVEMAHPRGVTVEGELGTLGGIEDGVGSGEVHLTDPDQAVDFVQRTGIDALAVAIGTSHGAYKFSRAPDGEVLAMERIKEIHKRLPDTHLVMHGSSSVPQELVDIINANGGSMKPTWGVPIAEIQTGIQHGVRKINVDTDSRLAMTGAIRTFMQEQPEEFDPRGYLKPARSAMQKVIGGADDGVRPGRPRGRLRADRPRRDGRALRPGGGSRLTALAEIDAALAAIPEEGRAAAAGPALVALARTTLLHGRGRAVRRHAPRAAARGRRRATRRRG